MEVTTINGKTYRASLPCAGNEGCGCACMIVAASLFYVLTTATPAIVAWIERN